MKIGVAVITHCSKQHLKRCLPPLLRSRLSPRVLVVNSSSQDGTVEEAKLLGAEVLVIHRKAFNHGSTRELARKHLNSDIVVMMTPDAYVQDETTLEKLVEPILKRHASVSYARQVPRPQAKPLEAFPRYFNYPEISHIRSIHDRHKWGVYTFFCSNSCAAYCMRALDEVGGFRSVLMSEDTFAVARLLRAGHNIAYVAEALVEHSHDYTLFQELQRHFDTGYVRSQHAHLIDFGSRDERRGARYTFELGRYLMRHRPRAIPYAILNNIAKYLGYSLGRLGPRLPQRFVRMLSSQDYYWTSDDYYKAMQERL